MDSYPSSSSSFPSLATKIKFDVFLSFRGTDTRQGFVSHLYKALCHKKVETFIDYKLREGDEISPTLLRAIEESQISLVIFSEDYASSRWCLEELEKIIECKTRNGQIVVPIFYKIQPSDVRSQRGSFGDAFAQLRERYKNHMNKVEKWRGAMNEAANLAGFPSSNYGTEAELIEEIVNRVLLRLNHMYQFDLQELIGIDEHIARIEYMMCREVEDVRLIGIWGMGGIGKTTIAGVIFNRLSSEYEGCCFLQVREEMEKYGITHLQNKLFSLLLGDNLKLISTPNILPTYVMRRLCRKKVLVILDDVSDSEQLRNLVGGLNWFGPGSRIIVTTRDKQVLGKQDAYIYEVSELSFDEAVQLFNLNAFKQNCVDIELTELSLKFVTYANGIPLALKVLGSFLYNKSKEEWESQWKKLGKMPFQKLHNILKLSYDGLDSEEENILKIIACFFEGLVERDLLKDALDACGYSTAIGLKSLLDKALIIASKNCFPKEAGPISMHELIQEMVKNIVREEFIEDPGKRSHLWDPNDIYQVLKNDKGTDAIQSITLHLSEIKNLSLDSQAFTKLSNLKFLNFHMDEDERSNLSAPQGLESLPEGLRIFCWDGYPMKSLPLSFCVENLVEISMPGSEIEKFWDGIQDIVNLEILDLRYCRHLMELPDCSKASNLQQVYLESCTALRYVHPSILSLHKLECLKVSGCTALENLRSDVHLQSLERLFANQCSSLKELSVTSEKMKYLDLTGSHIKNLSNDLACLRSLTRLELSESPQVNASALYVMFNDGLQSLVELNLDRCCNLYELPDNISLLSSLAWLSLKEVNIESLPTSIKHLSRLRVLCLQDCKRLQSLLELPPFIEYLNASNCTSLETLSILMSPNGQEILFPGISYVFANCVNLNEQALDVITYTQVRLKQVAVDNLLATRKGNCYRQFHVCFPGRNVPNWFSHSTTQASVAIELALDSNLMGFVMGLVVPQYPDNMNRQWVIGYKFCLKANDDERIYCTGSNPVDAFFESDRLISDHVILWYDEFDIQSITKEIVEQSIKKLLDEMSRPNNVCNIANCLVAEFEFFIDTESMFKAEIKECGVYPIYASEYPNLIQQIKAWGTKTTRHQDIYGFEPSNIGNGVNYNSGDKKPKESNFQSSSLEIREIDEAEARSIETGGESSAYANEDDLQPSSSKNAEGRKDELSGQASCDCLVGLLLKQFWRFVSSSWNSRT